MSLDNVVENLGLLGLLLPFAVGVILRSAGGRRDVAPCGVTILVGDCRERLQELPAESVHCVVTSPPYLGLRDYGVDRQIGQETPKRFIETMVGVFREVRRVLRKDGTLWLNLGDSYCHDSKWGGSSGGPNSCAGINGEGKSLFPRHKREPSGFKPKDRMMIPARVAIALQDDGWWVRDEIVWHKPNPMPSNVKDRTSPAHEMLFMLTRSRRYHYDGDAIAEPIAAASVARLSQNIEGQAGTTRAVGKTNGNLKAQVGGRRRNPDAAPKSMVMQESWSGRHEGYVPDGWRNKRSVWSIGQPPSGGPG